MNFPLLCWAALVAGAILLVSSSIAGVFNGASLIGVLLVIGPLLVQIPSSANQGGE
ncbi:MULTISPECIES: hypothetical protein [unclassified Pseudoclavibacter]|uniref:hypothetical protein n=1 Tax=unclassified Pseudoclavibacter TaxID=2615177 RepID=UPI0015E3408C|nr:MULTISPECIES: hypothetical protein [unclassified Pseudoclavibacter]MBF4549387.1 hypothetical protein [Pseudoclavibacter sp. VKM Ac-2888]